MSDVKEKVIGEEFEEEKDKWMVAQMAAQKKYAEEKLKKDRFQLSFIAHFLVFAISCFSTMIAYESSDLGFWRALPIGFLAIYVPAILLFLIFYVPLERVRLRKNSWRYLWLRNFAMDNDEMKINVCHLPGMIMQATVVSIAYLLFLFVGLILGNIFHPIFSGRYVKLEGGMPKIGKKIPWIPTKSFEGNGFVLGPWIFILAGLIMWICLRSHGHIKGLLSVIMSSFTIYMIFCLAFLLITAILLILNKLEFWTSIRQLFKSLSDRFCIIGEVVDE